MIKYEIGNLVKSDCDVIIHGCNCFHTMGSGIAKEIKEDYPAAYAADKVTSWGGISKLGKISYIDIRNKYFPDKKIRVVNAYTQYKYGREEGKVYADYDAIQSALQKVNDMFPVEFFPNIKIGMPKIGAGLAQGDWTIIEAIINKVFSSRTVYVYSLNTLNEIGNTVDIKKSLSDYKDVLKKIYK